jgi:HK97 family phage major capsid protein
MSDLAKREFEIYRNEDAEARSILDLAVTEKRDTTPEEDERFDKLVSSARTHKQRADKLVEMDSEAASAAATVRSLLGTTSQATDSDGLEAKPTGNAALIANLRSVQAAQKARLNDLELAVEMEVDLQKRAIADFSDNGALYTTDFATNIAIYQRTLSPWIDLSSIINSNNGRPLNLPKLTVDNTTYKPGEGTAITESTPTIGSAALTTTAYKGLSYISAEAEEDELVGLLPIIAKQQARSIGLSFGSDSTTAILAAINNGGTATGQGGTGTSTAPFFGWEDLIALFMGRAAPYRRNGVFVMANAAIQKVMKFRDGQGDYFYSAAGGPGLPPTVWGYPLYEDPNLAAPASVTKSVVFGDPTAALVIKQMPIRVAVSTDFKFDTDQVALKSVYRAGLAVPDPAAMAYLVSANT